MLTSVGMGVLHSYLRRYTKRPHAREVAELFGIWTGWPHFRARVVYDRVHGVRKRFPRQFRRLLREEDVWRRALRGPSPR